MNVITKSLEDIRFKIPRQILEVVFIKRVNDWSLSNTSINDAIMETVIRPRVLVDCNLVGGLEVFIPIKDSYFERIDDFNCIYRIPKTATQGRSILSVSSLTFNDPSRAASYGAMNAYGASQMLRAGQAMVDSVGSLPVTSTSNVTLIGENTILVKDYINIPTNVFLRCTVTNDENMNNIHPKSYIYFSKLFELAVKAYIYNEMQIRVDMGQIIAGNQIGAFKDIIDGYSDANEMYEEHLKTVIAKVSFMNDHQSMSRFVKQMVGIMR